MSEMRTYIIFKKDGKKFRTSHTSDKEELYINNNEWHQVIQVRIPNPKKLPYVVLREFTPKK